MNYETIREAIRQKIEERARNPRLKWCPHAPTERQRVFLELQTKEAFYGGAAGGGKSDALLMGALDYVDTPGYAALLLRRTYADLSLPSTHEPLA